MHVGKKSTFLWFPGDSGVGPSVIPSAPRSISPSLSWKARSPSPSALICQPSTPKNLDSTPISKSYMAKSWNTGSFPFVGQEGDNSKLNQRTEAENQAKGNVEIQGSDTSHEGYFFPGKGAERGHGENRGNPCQHTIVEIVSHQSINT